MISFTLYLSLSADNGIPSTSTTPLPVVPEEELPKVNLQPSKHLKFNTEHIKFYIIFYLVNLFLVSEEFITNYIDRKFEELQSEIIRQINSSKRSILYDLDRKIHEVKNMLISQPRTATNNIEQSREKLDVVLPIKSLENFLELEDSLMNSPEKKEALVFMNKNLLLQ